MLWGEGKAIMAESIGEGAYLSKDHCGPHSGFQSISTVHYFECGRLEGGTMPFMRRYSTICPK
jgi:hypothetical protein